MRWLLRAGIALAVLCALALGGLLVVLPRFAESEGVRQRIQVASRNALGRDVDYESIGIGLFPPSLQIEGPSVSGDAPGAPPLAKAERIDMRAALFPLLRGKLEVRSVVADGLELNLVRSADGFALPGAASTPKPEKAEDAAGKGAEAEEAGPLPLDVRRVLLRDSHLIVEDRSVKPPQTWDLRDLQLDLRPDGSEFELSASTQLASGGEVRIEGRADPEGEADLTLELRDFALSALASYLGERVAGALSGSVHATGPTTDPALAADLRAVDAVYGDYALRGPAELEARLAGFSPARGPFSLDLSGAAFAGAGITKPAGTKAVLTGTLAPDADGKAAIDDLRLALRNLVAKGRLRTAPRTALTLNAEPFELAGWEQLLPALSLAVPSGRLAASELSLRTGPTEARGTLRLEDVLLRPPGRQAMALAGEIDLLGDVLKSRELTLGAADQRFQVDARIDSLFARPRYRVDFKTLPTGAEVNSLLAAFAGQPDRIFGPLVGGGVLTGTLGGDTDFLQALDGDLSFGINEGRIVGASILEGVLGPLGATLAKLGKDRVGGDLKRFYGETFESLTAALRIENGQVIARPLTLVYQGYSATLEGPLSLADLSLDLRGTLTVHESLDAELAKAFGSGSNYAPRRRTLPLAAVRGNLGAPKVQLSGSALEQIATAYAVDSYTGELRKKVEGELGPGTGQIVDEGLRVLDGLLGRPRSKTPDAPQEAPAQAPVAAPPKDAPQAPAPEPAPEPTEAPVSPPSDG